MGGIDPERYRSRVDRWPLMAKRPIFIPLHDGKRYVLERYVDFNWHAGFAKSQKQKSIRALHEMAFEEYGVTNPLEVSSKSEDPLGVAMSSFNLTFTTKLGRSLTVEAAFQGSKVFESGGPFLDIFEKPPIEAKRDERLRSSGALTKFSFFGTDWALEPKTAFYDWLYINALLKNPKLVVQVTDRDGFTDIEFNPERSINCQARSVALFCALYHNDKLTFALESKENFLSLYKGRVSDPHQPRATPSRRPTPYTPPMSDDLFASASRAGVEHDAHSIEGGRARPTAAGPIRTMRRIFFPIFNWGQAGLIFLLIVLLASIAVFSDPVLALYMGVGAYAGIVINSVLRGLAPDEAEISEDEIGPISSMLANERFVHPIGERVWAPSAARSWLFKSDWISIDEIEGKKFILRARKRDLKIILPEIRRKTAG